MPNNWKTKGLAFWLSFKLEKKKKKEHLLLIADVLPIQLTLITAAEKG
jgi:hypothetical protein